MKILILALTLSACNRAEGTVVGPNDKCSDGQCSTPLAELELPPCNPLCIRAKCNQWAKTSKRGGRWADKCFRQYTKNNNECILVGCGR